MSTSEKTKLFVDAIDDCIKRASAGGTILSVGAEAARIADRIGLPRRVVAERLVEAASEAQIAMELPTAVELGIA
jgi:hypothetical protein